MTNADITIRNVNVDVLQDFKAEAVREKKTFGKALAEALLLWLQSRKAHKRQKSSLLNIKPVDFGQGTEHLSENIDNELYGR